MKEGPESHSIEFSVSELGGNPIAVWGEIELGENPDHKSTHPTTPSHAHTVVLKDSGGPDDRSRAGKRLQDQRS